MSASKKKVSYYYDPDIGNFYYGQGHPMKPHRIRVAHHMIVAYDMYRKMEVGGGARHAYAALLVC
eukprot:SAG22_NODE_547_length_9252_cov_27.855894_4_plen_65_part_00